MTTKEAMAVFDRWILPRNEKRHEKRGEAWDIHDTNQLVGAITMKSDRLKYNSARGNLTEELITDEVPEILSYCLKVLHNMNLDTDRRSEVDLTPESYVRRNSQPRGCGEAEAPPMPSGE